MSVPRTVFGPRKVKAALTRTSKISSFVGIPIRFPIITSNLALDLDLKIFDENGVRNLKSEADMCATATPKTEVPPQFFCPPPLGV